MNALRLTLVVAALSSLSCNEAPTYAKDVKPILDARCLSCHVEGGIGTFALGSYTQAKTFGLAIANAVSSGRMPPWKAGPADVEYLHNPTLTDAQKATIAAWVKGGMLEGDSKNPGKPLDSLGGGLDRVDLTLEMPQPYTPVKRPDDYRCFVLRWPKSTPTYVTGVNAVPGVKTMVHHIALYLVPPDAANLPVEWDAEDATPGYECFGGPFGKHSQQFAVGLLNAWIPGIDGMQFPRGGGIYVPPGATVVLQLHYNLDDRPALEDKTAMQFQLADSVPTKMAYQPFLNAGWVAGNMEIPAGATDVLHQYGADPRSFFGVLGSPLDTTNGFNIEGVMFHMHTLGKTGQLWLEKPPRNGQPTQRIKVIDIPAWDFNWQQQYMLKQPVRFESGDVLRVKCVFDNSQPRSGEAAPQTTNWGENSSEEMCVANILSSE